MTDPSQNTFDAYQHQLSILARSFHPSGAFIRFEKEEIEQSIPDRFEEQVRKYPQRIAIKTSSAELTYHELNQAANQVAHMVLEQIGAGEEPVALLFGQGDQAITAILGVLKAGEIFVPLDTSFPRSRIRYMAEEVRARLILTDSRNLSLARELAKDRCRVINIDELVPGLSTNNPGLPISPDAIARIVYTSGSTGEPKGVIQNHRNVLHAAMDNTNVFHICSYDCMTLLFTHAGAAGLTDIFQALLNGAALYQFDLKGEGVGRLDDWLIQNEISIYHSVPSVFRQFIGTLTGGQDLLKLRHLYIQGEPTYKSDIELYSQRFLPDCIFVNVLGSTEAHNFRWYFIDRETLIPGSNVPVGYDFTDGLKVLLLDDDGREVGFNCIGEIAVRSRYLSLGYWRRPDLTRAAFLDDPGGGDERIYLTGDLGRMSVDGCLEHLGRRDNQVQVRGYRVELAEIETVLVGLDIIKEAAVVAREDPSGGQRLVAYLVPVATPPPTVSDLRGRLEEKLPDFMVPSAFVFLGALPLLPSGKVDQLALPQPGPERPNLDSLFVAPRTPVEETLVKIWSEVLGLDQIGIHDDFLDLGGDSLMATQVFSRVVSTFRTDVPLRSFFEAPTVAHMAAVVNQILCGEGWSEAASSVAAVQPHGSKPPLFCVTRATFACHRLAGYLAPDQPIYHVFADFDAGELPFSQIEAHATQHVEDIRAVQPEGPYFLGGWEFGGVVAIEIARQLSDQGHDVGLVALFDTYPPDLDRRILGSYYLGRINHHWKQLPHLRAKDKLAYVFIRLRPVPRRLFRQAVYMVSQRIGLRVPRALQDSGWIQRSATSCGVGYRRKTYDGDVTLFRAKDHGRYPESDDLGWEELVTGRFEIYEVPGDHCTLFAEHNVRELAEKLSESLYKARTRHFTNVVG